MVGTLSSEAEFTGDRDSPDGISVPNCLTSASSV